MKWTRLSAFKSWQENAFAGFSLFLKPAKITFARQRKKITVYFYDGRCHFIYGTFRLPALLLQRRG